jgi:hypothetical protein
MPRHGGSQGAHHTTKQKGRHRDGKGTYARRQKAKNAIRYDRPFSDGTYSKTDLGEGKKSGW